MASKDKDAAVGRGKKGSKGASAKSPMKTESMKLTGFQSFAYKHLRKMGTSYARKHPELGESLAKARFHIIPEAYAATAFMIMIISFFIAPIIGPLVVYQYFLKMRINSAIESRKKNIEIQLPYAVNFLAAMAATNATPEVILKSLAGQKEIYGDICDEASWIYRDTRILGIDIIKALKNGIKRSPSRKFGEFIQGIINSLTSGRPLKGYLTDIANKYMDENRMEQQKFLETLAFLAESYVVVGVAFPIFFMVIMIIMYWVSGSGMQVTDEMLYAVVFGMLGIINGVYLFIVKIVTPEV